MKIAVCGVHGTGKTTICNKVKEILGDNVEVVKETYRDLLKDDEFLKKSLKEQTIITNQRHYDAEKNCKGNNILCDRLPIDAWCYYAWKNEKPLSSISRSIQVKEHILKALEHLKTYDMIFFIVPNSKFPIEDDGVRYTNILERMKLHYKFISIFRDNIDLKQVNVIKTNQIRQNDMIDTIVCSFRDGALKQYPAYRFEHRSTYSNTKSKVKDTSKVKKINIKKTEDRIIGITDNIAMLKREMEFTNRPAVNYEREKLINSLEITLKKLKNSLQNN